MAQPLPERVMDVNEASQNTVDVDNIDMAPIAMDCLIAAGNLAGVSEVQPRLSPCLVVDRLLGCWVCTLETGGIDGGP